MNTVIEYMYRDAANYKFWYDAVVSGKISEDQAKTIIGCLDEGRYFIPGQVGLPCDYAMNCEYDEDLDHPWCELCDDFMDYTEEDPTVEMTVEELVAAFQAAKGNWNEEVQL